MSLCSLWTLSSPALDPIKLSVYISTSTLLHEKRNFSAQGRSLHLRHRSYPRNRGGTMRDEIKLWNAGEYVSCLFYLSLSPLSGSWMYYTICPSCKVWPGQRNECVALFKDLASIYWDASRGQSSEWSVLLILSWVIQLWSPGCISH